MRETLHKVDANDSNDDDKHKAENIQQKVLEMFAQTKKQKSIGLNEMKLSLAAKVLGVQTLIY